MNKNLKVYSNVDLRENELLNVKKIEGSEFSNSDLYITTKEAPEESKTAGNLILQPGKNKVDPSKSGKLYLCGSSTDLENLDEDIYGSLSAEGSQSKIELDEEGVINTTSSNLIISMSPFHMISTAEDNTFINLTGYTGIENYKASSNIFLSTSKKLVAWDTIINENFPSIDDITSGTSGYFIDSPNLQIRSRFLKESLKNLKTNATYEELSFYERTAKQDLTITPNKKLKNNNGKYEEITEDDTSGVSYSNIFEEKAGPRNPEGLEDKDYSYQVDVKRIQEYEKNDLNEWEKKGDSSYESSVKADNLNLNNSFQLKTLDSSTAINANSASISLESPSIKFNESGTSNVIQIDSANYHLTDVEGTSNLEVDNLIVDASSTFNKEIELISPTIEVKNDPLQINSTKGYEINYGEEGSKKSILVAAVNGENSTATLSVDNIEASTSISSEKESYLKGSNFLQGATLIGKFSEEGETTDSFEEEIKKLKNEKSFEFSSIKRTSEDSTEGNYYKLSEETSQISPSKTLHVSSENVIIGELAYDDEEGSSFSEEENAKIKKPIKEVTLNAEKAYFKTEIQLNEGELLNENHETIETNTNRFDLLVGRGYADEKYPVISSYSKDSNSEPTTQIYTDYLIADGFVTTKTLRLVGHPIENSSAETSTKKGLVIYFDENSESVVFAATN